MPGTLEKETVTGVLQPDDSAKTAGAKNASSPLKFATQETAHSDKVEPRIEANSASERKLLLKCDIRILPILALLFLISFVDRTNIANAKIEGMEKELYMTGNDYNIALLVFIAPYVVFEVPSNIILKNVRPSVWISSLMLGWGVCSMCLGLTQSYGGLVTTRFLMGLFEAGFVPGCAFLISAYYKRHECQLRYSLFFSAAIFASAFSAFLAYLLEKMDGVGGYSGWRWIFIVEGLLTIVVSFAAYWLIVPWPQDCDFLSVAEKELLLKRLTVDSGVAQMSRLDRPALKRCLTDWKVWIGTGAYFCVINGASSVVYFVPTIIKDLGYTSAQAQVYTIPVFMVALVVSIAAAWASDRLSHRYAFCLGGVVLATAGWAIELAQVRSAAVRYFGIFAIVAGVYAMQPILVVWLANNLGGQYKRSVGTALQIAGGNCGGFTAANVFIADQAPRYPVGFGVGFALSVLCGMLCSLLVVGLARENARRERGGRDYRLALPAYELENIGDDHPAFRFTL